MHIGNHWHGIGQNRDLPLADPYETSRRSCPQATAIRRACCSFDHPLSHECAGERPVGASSQAVGGTHCAPVVHRTSGSARKVRPIYWTVPLSRTKNGGAQQTALEEP